VADLPSYDQLPASDGKPKGSSWALWGEGDVLGTLNLLTPERVQRAAGCIRRGVVFSLNPPMHEPHPPLFERPAFRHEVEWLANDVGHDEQIHGWNTQSSAQWDGFRHIKHPVHGFYNGVADEDHGVHHWASKGLAGRAVLADVARWREAQGRPLRPDESDPIEADDLTATLAAQGVEVEPGDVLLIRTGWLGWHRSLDAAAKEAYVTAGHPSVGLRPGEPMWTLLWNLHIAGVASDNPALEVWPPATFVTPEQFQEVMADMERFDEVFMHFRLLPLLGLPIGELWELDALAEDCASDGVYEAFFTSAPLNLASGVASPPNALAIK
jgi:hypothetical protein